jgi:hypothetical protein
MDNNKIDFIGLIEQFQPTRSQIATFKTDFSLRLCAPI